MNILCQSLQKQNLNTTQTIPSTIPPTTPLTIHSDLPERLKVQTPAWVMESKAIREKTVRKFNSTTKQTELEGKVSHNSFDSNIELIVGFQNLNREFEFTNQEKYISVKGKLKQNQSFWKNTIKANDTVLNIIQGGNRLPFLETPDTARSSNNKSAINNSDFVENSIKEMLATGTILEWDHRPRVVNPLSVSIDSSGKKGLILDLRYVNMHLYKDKIKFDDWKCFENYLIANKSYLFKFDLKNVYHHIDIFDSLQTYLGFSWDIKGATKYFVFTALPFGLSSAPFVFTKVVL